MSGATARVFVALSLPGELAAPLAAAAAEVLPERAYRLTSAEDLHLTLLFLGEVERARLAPLGAALQEAVAPLAPPELELDAPGAFPDVRTARVLWAGVRERSPGRLAAARAAAVAACLRVELPLADQERERFHPHVTLARPRRAGAVPAGFLALVPRGTFRPGAAQLLESCRQAGAPHYVERARAGFREIS